jgi:glucose-6-phosphate dehydrogenase assembly protein OpcA
MLMPAVTEFPVVGQSVEVPRIDEALRELWASNAAVSKASLINFAIYSEDPSSLGGNTRLIEAVTREHACRAILIAGQPGEGETRVRAWITAHCQLAGGGKSICSEQIAFLLDGRLGDLLRNIVFAHLESDLPLVFFWQGGFTDRWEPHLYRHIDRLVIDSERWDDPAAQLDKMQAACRDAVSHFVVLDIVWMRLFSFRLALAGAFDEASARELFERFQSIEIVHAPGHALAARLLAAWVLHKAGWTVDQIDISFVENPGAPLGRLCLATDDSRVVISREPGGAFVESRIETPRRTIEHAAPALSDDCASLVTERLSRGGNNALYFKLWRFARSLL